MKVYHLFYIIGLLLFTYASCKNDHIQVEEEDLIWRLGWRMIENQMNGNDELAETQFDSLLMMADNFEKGFLKTGLQLKSSSGKDDEVQEILAKQDDELLQWLCKDELLSKYELCGTLTEETVTHPQQRDQIMQLYFDDQASRGNVMQEIVERYNIDTSLYHGESGIDIDLMNREKLQSIISEHGFPTKEMVGSEAMQAIFLVIQHADRDPEWQADQLPLIKNAVDAGDMEGQSYAYLYDRIQTKVSGAQLYGTQISSIDPVTKEVILFEIENEESLDERRRKFGIMPIDMYKRITLKMLGQ